MEEEKVSDETSRQWIMDVFNCADSSFVLTSCDCISRSFSVGWTTRSDKRLFKTPKSKVDPYLSSRCHLDTHKEASHQLDNNAAMKCKTWRQQQSVIAQATFQRATKCNNELFQRWHTLSVRTACQISWNLVSIFLTRRFKQVGESNCLAHCLWVVGDHRNLNYWWIEKIIRMEMCWLELFFEQKTLEKFQLCQENRCVMDGGMERKGNFVPLTSFNRMHERIAGVIEVRACRAKSGRWSAFQLSWWFLLTDDFFLFFLI